MIDDFDLKQRRAELSQLSARHRTAFAAATAERLLPNYSAFARENSWGNPDLLRESLTSVWDALARGSLEQTRFREMQEKCDEVVPHADNFAGALTSAAIDAGNAVCETLACAMDGSAERAADVASFAYDTVHMHVQEIEDLDYDDPAFDGRIVTHPLIQRELLEQKKQLQLLREDDTLHATTLDALRKSWNNGGRSNIDIG